MTSNVWHIILYFSENSVYIRKRNTLYCVNKANDCRWMNGVNSPNSPEHRRSHCYLHICGVRIRNKRNKRSLNWNSWQRSQVARLFHEQIMRWEAKIREVYRERATFKINDRRWHDCTFALFGSPNFESARDTVVYGTNPIRSTTLRAHNQLNANIK